MVRYNSISSYLGDAAKKGLFNGVWGLKKGDEFIAQGSVGSRYPGKNLPMDMDTLFDIASVSKQFTAAAIMLLVDRGVLKLEEQLEKFYPGTMYHSVTIEQLLTHTSGMPDYMSWMLEYVEKNGMCSAKEMINSLLYLSHLPLQFEPGEIFCYCNTGYCILGDIVEMVSGRSFGDFLKAEIFIPAGMKKTELAHNMPFRTYEGNTAFGTVIENNCPTLVAQSKTESYTLHLPNLAGDGQVITSVNELHAWDRALREGAVLSKEIQERMYTSKIMPDGSSTGYGYGWCLAENEIGQKVISHTGRWAGYLSYFGRIPKEDAALVVLCNQYGQDVYSWIEMESAFERFLSGEKNIGEPRCLDDVSVRTQEANARLVGALGKYVIETEEIKGLFDKNISVQEEDGIITVDLTFMGDVFHSELVPLENGHYLERRGLFDFQIEENCLVTSMYNKRFCFVRE